MTVTSPEVEFDKLDRIAENQAAAYQSAEPFPHIVIDDFANPELLDRVGHEGGASLTEQWVSMNDEYQRKFANANMRQMGPNTRAIINFMNSQELLGFLERFTGLQRLAHRVTR